MPKDIFCLRKGADHPEPSRRVHLQRCVLGDFIFLCSRATFRRSLFGVCGGLFVMQVCPRNPGESRCMLEDSQFEQGLEMLCVALASTYMAPVVH